jgi:hypothetical protein
MAQNRAEHYRKQAEDCRLQAERSKFESDKVRWLKIAGQWQRMAEEADPADVSPCGNGGIGPCALSRADPLSGGQYSALLSAIGAKPTCRDLGRKR